MVGLNNSMIGGMGLGGLAGIGTTEVMSHVIMCSNLPALISEEQIKELFSPFGEVGLIVVDWDGHLKLTFFILLTAEGLQHHPHV
jgi:hypothetical protein